MSPSPAVTVPVPDPAVAGYLEHVTVARRLAPRSVAMIADGLARLQARCEQEGLALSQVQAHHVRSWLARDRKSVV